MGHNNISDMYYFMHMCFRKRLENNRKFEKKTVCLWGILNFSKDCSSGESIVLDRSWDGQFRLAMCL